MANPLLSLALVAYTAGVVLSILATAKRSRAARTGSTAALVLACALHFGGLTAYALRAGHVPMTNLQEFLLSLGWLVLAAHLWVQFRWNVDAAGLVLPPLAMIMTVIAVVTLPEPASQGRLLQKVDILLFHTVLASLGMAAFFVAAAMSLIYVLQDHALKSKRSLPWLERLPPLDRADRAGLEAMLWGFPLFTLGILTGVGLSMASYDRPITLLDPKQVFPLFAWAIFAGVLLARLARGFRGRRAAYLTIVGFLLGLLTIAGIPS